MHKPVTAHELEVYWAELAAVDRRRARDPVYKAQTATLQWLRRFGHAVDFSNDPIFTPELPGKPSAFVPNELALYDGKPCPYCSHEMRFGTSKPPSRDHVRPRSKGGTFAKGNKLIVCRPCNNDKDNKTLKEFAEWLAANNDPRAGLVYDLVRRGG